MPGRAHSQAYTVTPIGFVRGGRSEPVDDNWSAVTSEIQLDSQELDATATAGLHAFSHVDVVYLFDQVDPSPSAPAIGIPGGGPTGRRWASWPSERRTVQTASA